MFKTYGCSFGRSVVNALLHKGISNPYRSRYNLSAINVNKHTSSAINVKRNTCSELINAKPMGTIS